MNNQDYSLEDEAELLSWAGRVARVNRKELMAWVGKTLDTEPNCRAEKETRYKLAEVFAAIIKRHIEATGGDDDWRSLLGKLGAIMAEGDGGN